MKIRYGLVLVMAIALGVGGCASGGGGDLPFGDRIQESFGRHDVSGIRAHSDSAAVEANRVLGMHVPWPEQSLGHSERWQAEPS